MSASVHHFAQIFQPSIEILKVITFFNQLQAPLLEYQHRLSHRIQRLNLNLLRMQV
jgi:hypothetical protein